jgi:hypothetical protein
VSIEAQRITDDEERAALRDAGMGEVAVEGIVGTGVGTRDGFTPEQPRSVLTTTPSMGDHPPATGAVAAPRCTSFRR